jgi:inhibitor of KinA
MTETVFPRLVPVADRALLVEFGDTVDDQVHDKVLALDAALREAAIPGIVEVIPAMVNLLLIFDPLQTDHGSIAKAVKVRLDRLTRTARPVAQHEVQVCYEDSFGPDLAAVSAQTGLSVDAVIAAHLAGDYSVYMYGFAPGYAYLSGLRDEIRLPRKSAPVRNVPAGSVIIAGGQCLITTLTMPTGWWVIGRSPARILTGAEDRPFLFDVGDSVQFRRVGRDALSSAAGA